MKKMKVRKETKKKCIHCGEKVEKDLLYGDGVCEKCIQAGLPPFR